MDQIKKYGLVALRLFAPVGVGVAAVIGLLGGLQALVGFSPVGEKWLIAALVLFLVCGAILLIQHEVQLRDYEHGIGNEHSKALWRDGIPAVQYEYLDRVRRGDYSTVNRFWSAGFVNVSDGHGKYDLHIACETGHAAIVQGILERGGDPRRPDKSGTTPLMFACVKGFINVAQKLLEHDCAIDAKAAHGGFVALHTAAAHGHAAMVDDILKWGGRVDATDDDNITPLMAAMARKKWEVAAMLLDAGGNAHRVDSSGATLMDYAVAFGAPAPIVARLSELGIGRATRSLINTGGGFSTVGKVRVKWKSEEAEPAKPV